MIQRRAAAAGYTAAQVDLLGGHSLRSGFVTEAFRAGADAHSIVRQTGHRDPKMLEVYAREFASPGRQRGAEIGPSPVTSAGTAKSLSASTQARVRGGLGLSRRLVRSHQCSSQIG